MLQKLTEETKDCYRRAEQCHRQAEHTRDAAAREDFLTMEQRWLHLARSYEFTERLVAFTIEAARNRRRH